MEAELVVARNFPWCPEHDDRSFGGRLHEEQIWDWEEYWLLEKALYDLTTSSEFCRERTWRIFRIFSYCFLLLGCHFDPDDLFKINGMSTEEVRDVRERFQLVFEGFFAGEMPAQEIFDIRNP